MTITKTNLFITGATGFVGRALVSHLVQKDKYAIKALMRDAKKTSLLDTSVQPVIGDLTDRQSYENALEGVDTVIHLAGQLQAKGANKESFTMANVTGTQELVEACKDKGISKFIYCSSASVYGSKSDGKPRSETTEPAPDSSYGITKYEAERVLLKKFDPDEISLTIMRPSGVYGPGDMKGLSMFEGIKRDKLRFYLNSSQIIHPTHVMDVAHAIESIIEKHGLRHEIINIAGEKRMRLMDLIAFVAKLMNKNIIQVSAPQWALPVISYFALAGYKLVGRKCPFEWKVASKVIDHSNDISKAEKLIGFKPVSFHKGMEETYDWYVKNNYLKV